LRGHPRQSDLGCLFNISIKSGIFFLLTLTPLNLRIKIQING
jgi:hypothetical protein